VSRAAEARLFRKSRASFPPKTLIERFFCRGGPERTLDLSREERHHIIMIRDLSDRLDDKGIQRFRTVF